MNKALDVYLNADLVGTFELGSSDEMLFTYSDDAGLPISVGMPVEQKHFGNLHCEAFFGGLLPEGDAARKALGRRFGVSADNNEGLELCEPRRQDSYLFGPGAISPAHLSPRQFGELPSQPFPASNSLLRSLHQPNICSSRSLRFRRTIPLRLPISRQLRVLLPLLKIL